MTSLSTRLVESMHSRGFAQVNESIKNHLRRKLESEFAGAIHIISDDKGKLLLYPDNLSIVELAKKNQSLITELEMLNKLGAEDTVAKAALQLRSEIKKQEVPQAWPPEISDEEVDDAMIPKGVSRFLRYLLTGSDDDRVSQRVQRLICSFGYDMVYAISHGRTKPPKHITLPYAVKSLTGNVELISILNRLGHSVSYSQVEEIDTALCFQKLSLSDEVALPANIHPGVFTTLAYDNIDRLEETVSGEGTSHRVNGIAIQGKHTMPQPPRKLPSVSKTKKRSINPSQQMLPTYNVGQREGPPQSMSVEVDHAAATQSARKKNLVWIMARISAQTVSSWTGFNIQTHDISVTPDNVGYLPTINAPATQMSTINEVLNQCISIKQSLQLRKIVCVFDQALYAKAAEVMWKHQEKFKNTVIIRMGVFHTTCILMSIIGKRFKDAGLRDLCIESGVIAEGSVSGVMDGHKYNRAIRLHKLVYEALVRLAWKSFPSWLQATHASDAVHMDETLKVINNLCSDVSQTSLEQVLQNGSCTRILELFEVYLTVLRGDSGNLSEFWMSYLDMVEILLGLIRASREGDWMLHLACIRAMIPWCFAYDRLNYARYLPYYYAQMSRLPDEHPNVHAEFMRGGFSVQLGSTNTFGRIPVDQTIEETVNKDTQTPGGTKGFSLKVGAVSKYYLTAEYRTMYLRKLRNMINQRNSKWTHPDIQPMRIKKDQADVESLVDLMENSWLNPLGSDENELVSLSTGTVAPLEVTRDLLRAHDIGEEEYQTFRRTRLEEDPPKVKFFDKMSKAKLKTFSSISAKIFSTRGKAKDVVMKADRNLFGHMILIAEKRQLHMRDVLAHPLGPLPWALANADGSLRKTNKAVLARQLEKNATPAEDIITSPSVCLIDGMGLVQKMNGNNKTFAELADSVLDLVLHEGAQSQRIDVVFDVYRDESIKNAERSNRGSATALQYKNIAGGHHIQQWRKFLCSSCNKTSLIKFLVQMWRQPKSREKLQDKSLYVTCEEDCFRITKDNWKEVSELQSTQEEADTRLLLHALHAANSGSKAVIIIAQDTDVMILSLAFNKEIPCLLYLKSGTKNRTRFIDIGKLVRAIGNDICTALVGLHAFTGCDTVSAFTGRGKLGALKLLRKDKMYQEAFCELGQTWEVSPRLFENIQQFICRMYAATSITTDVNELRYQLFCARRGEVDSSQLPPCKDCLFMHTLRANYQAAVWKRCLQTKPTVPDPKGCGWTADKDGFLDIEWMRTPSAPDAVLELLSCKCKRSCSLPDCTCLANSLVCTDMCKLQTCTNQRQEEEEEELDIELGNSDEDDEDNENG